MLYETSEKLEHSLRPLAVPAQEPIRLASRDLCALGKLPLDITAESQVIGEDKVFERTAIAGQLFRTLGRIEGLAYVLRLYVAQYQAGTEDAEIGRSAGFTLRFVDGDEPGSYRFNQALQGGAVCVLARTSRGKT